MIVKSAQIRDSLEKLRVESAPRGESTGFEALDKIYSLKQGSFTFILAPPANGKSELCFELIFNQAAKYGKKSLVYSPETGSVEDIYAEFIHKYTGQHIFKQVPGHLEDKLFYNAVRYVDEMFSIVDSDEKNYSFKELTDLVTDEQIILSDPYNELKHDMTEFGARQDLYIEQLCGDIRRYCKKYKKHCLQTLHPAHQQLVTEGGIRYYPMPMAREAAGGQALFRKAMTWINMWRPPTGLLNDGFPYGENEVLIMIEKAKPKGVAEKGVTSLFFDWKKNRYFEKHPDFNTNFYAFELESFRNKEVLPVSHQFDL